MKKLTLPKEFGIKWLEALRGGDYQQARGTLCEVSKKDPTTFGYCCLGVGGVIGGAKPDILIDNGTLNLQLHSEFVPSVIIGDASENKFVELVAPLNDGCLKAEFNLRVEEGFIFDAEIIELFKYIADGARGRQLTFIEIAKIIEDNTEFV